MYLLYIFSDNCPGIVKSMVIYSATKSMLLLNDMSISHFVGYRESSRGTKALNFSLPLLILKARHFPFNLHEYNRRVSLPKQVLGWFPLQCSME